jgi:carboxylesterase
MKNITYQVLLLLLICGLFVGCNKEPVFEDYMLDNDINFDPSINNPEEFLVSAKYPQPTPLDLEKHIIIAVHGYTASTFEWSEFREWSTDSSYRISQVLLGGHGTTYEDFKASKWEDWSESIRLEYEKLENMGYEKISFVGSSTGGLLLLELVESKYFQNHVIPKNIFLIDPVIVGSEKLGSIAGIIGPMLVYIESDQSAEKDKYWYRFKPHETISQLNELMKKVRKGLEDGFSLPGDTYLKAFHSKHDPTANSLSTVLIYKGLTKSDGSHIDVQIMDSDIHVFTRLKIRESVSALNLENQEDAFTQMAQKLSK